MQNLPGPISNLQSPIPPSTALSREQREQTGGQYYAHYRAEHGAVKAHTSGRSALLTLMAQIGSFVPARQATIGGGRPDIRPGRRKRRTYPRTKHLHGRDDRDGADSQHRHRAEPGHSRRDRSAAPAPTMASRWPGRSSNTLHERIGCRTFFATHYHELTDLEQSLPGVKNLNVGRPRVGRQGDFPAQDRCRCGGQELRDTRRPAGRCAPRGDRAVEGRADAA